jgi:hypothetical protein
MNCELVSDITFAGGWPATEAETQVQAAVGFTPLAFCKGPLAYLRSFGGSSRFSRSWASSWPRFKT